jgi:hypothetical protein
MRQEIYNEPAEARNVRRWALRETGSGNINLVLVDGAGEVVDGGYVIHLAMNGSVSRWPNVTNRYGLKTRSDGRVYGARI